MPGTKRTSSAMSSTSHASSPSRSGSTGRSSIPGSSRAPSLRRAPTLPLVEDGVDRKEDVEPDAGDIESIVTTVKKLRSGSSIGCTAVDGAKEHASSSKKLSLTKKSSLVKSLSDSRQELDEIDEARQEGDLIVVAPPLPPGGLLEIVFSFDTTGSMHGVLEEVRGRLKDLIQRLQADIPGMRIAIFAHGDYCDKDNYVTKWIDFGATVVDLCEFVSNVKGTGGGDADECYELVLRQVREELSWSPDSQRALVMIGDCNPHEPSYYDNVLNIDWREEVKALNGMAVKIYGVQCGPSAPEFYQKISDGTGGLKLKLDQFSNIFDIIMAICYREGGAELITNYEAEVRKREGGRVLNKDLEGLFGILRDEDTAAHPGTSMVRSTAVPKYVRKLKLVEKRGAKATPKAVVKRNKKLTDVSTTKNARKGTKNSGTGERRFREVVPITRFRLESNLKWTRWKQVILPIDPGNKSWRPRSGGVGSHIRTIYSGQLDVPAVYEFSVQRRRCTKRFAVYFKVVAGRKSVTNWEKYLLSDPSVKKEIEHAVGIKGRLFMRRAVMNKRTKADKLKQLLEAKKELMRKYDYAWVRYPPKRMCHRQKKTSSKFVISHSDF